jgi:hypothetical protein
LCRSRRRMNIRRGSLINDAQLGEAHSPTPDVQWPSSMRALLIANAHRISRCFCLF